MKRKYVIASLAVLGTMAIASPVWGGPSLSSLVKTEVAKQLSAQSAKKKAKRGPQGLQGPAGPAGASGPPGPPGTGKAGARVVGSSAAITAGTAFGGIELAKDAAGGYCIRVPFTPVNVVATTTTIDHHARAELASVSGFGICSSLLPGYQAWVNTLDDTNSLSDSNFFVLVN